MREKFQGDALRLMAVLRFGWKLRAACTRPPRCGLPRPARPPQRLEPFPAGRSVSRDILLGDEFRRPGHRTQSSEEVLAVLGIAEDGAAFDPSHHDVVERVGGIQARAAGHSGGDRSVKERKKQRITDLSAICGLWGEAAGTASRSSSAKRWLLSSGAFRSMRAAHLRTGIRRTVG